MLAVSFLVMSLLIPATEETINRGLIMHTLIARGRIPALILSSALFAIVHNPQAILIAFLGGLFLGMQVVNCRTLWAPLITHATYNAVAVIDSECISVQWNPVEMTNSIIGTGLIASALAVVGMALSILLVMQKDTGAHERPDVARC
ncbi:MAG: lysostaphin resistance A-like protein [Woeseia sp.]